MHIDHLSIVYLLGPPEDFAAAAEFVRAADTLQLAEGVFLTRGADHSALQAGIESRLLPRAAFFVCSFRHADAAAHSGAIPIRTELMRWLNKPRG